MTSEIRTNSLKSRAGLSTVTMTDSGPMFSGITTFVDNSGFTFGVGGGTSIFTPATNVLTFGTNNTEKVRIDANGNTNITGILTASSFSGGTGTFAGDVSIADKIIHTGDTDTAIRFSQNDNISFETAGSERLRIRSNGQLLVGATSNSTGGIAEFSKSVGGGAGGCHIVVENTSTNSVNNTAGIHLKTDTGTAKFFKYSAAQTFIQSAAGGASELLLQASGAHPMRLYTNSNERARITSDGELVIGMTAGSGASPDARLQVRGDTFAKAQIQVLSTHNDDNPASLQISKSRGSGNTILGDNDDIGQINFAGNDGNGFHNVGRIMVSSSGEGNGNDDLPSVMRFFTTANGGVSLTERMRLNSNGSLSIANTRNYYGALNVEKTSTSSSAIDIKADGSGGSYAKAITVGDHNTIQGDWSVKNSSDVFFGTNTNHSLTFGVNNTEKMRLNLHGFLKCMGDMTSHMSADGNNYHEMQADNPHTQILNMKHGSSNGYGIMMQFNHAKSTHWAFRVYSFASGTTHMFIRTDGDCENTNNSYGQISDVKLKENIVDANSQWDDIKALKVRNFNFKSSTGLPTHKQLGLVAQEAETVCPGIVKTQPDLGPENEDLGTTTKSIKYSVLYMKAIKALQEAQERIEKLEQDNIALRARVTNLEGN